jgi:UDP-glucose 4-epimerase
VFFIYNFAFIGTSVAIGVFLTQNGYNVVGIDYKDGCSLSDILYYKVDITSLNALEEVFSDIAGKNIKFEAICHFAGFYNMDSLVEISEEDIKRYNKYQFILGPLGSFCLADSHIY